MVVVNFELIMQNPSEDQYQQLESKVCDALYVLEKDLLEFRMMSSLKQWSTWSISRTGGFGLGSRKSSSKFIYFYEV